MRRASRPRPAAGPDTRFGDGKNTVARSISRRSASVSFGSARSVLMGSRATAVKLLCRCHRCHRRQSACVTCHGRDAPDLPNGRAPKPCRAPDYGRLCFAFAGPGLVRRGGGGEQQQLHGRLRVAAAGARTLHGCSSAQQRCRCRISRVCAPAAHAAHLLGACAAAAAAAVPRPARLRNARSAFKPRWGRRGATRLPRRARRPAARACSASRPRAPAAGARFPCTGRRAPDIGTSPGPQLSAPHSALA